MMPPNGAESRADALATLGRVAHERFISEETGALLDAAAAEVNGNPDDDGAALVRVVRRDWDKARRVPAELAAELARGASIGQEAWAKARAENDFQAFAPDLERNCHSRARTWTASTSTNAVTTRCSTTMTRR